MTSTKCGYMRPLLGVYVLGAIEPAERALVDGHLNICRDCRDELAGLAGLPALLGRVTEEQIAQVGAPPDALLEPILAEAAAHSRARWRRNREWIAAAAAVALLAGGIGVFGGTRMAGRTTAAPSVTTTVTQTPAATVPAGVEVSGRDPATGVSAQVMMQAKGWGTAFTVRLTGAPPGSRCRLVVIGADGRRDIAGGWHVEYTESATFQGSSMIPQDRIVSLEVRTVDGKRLLTIPA